MHMAVRISDFRALAGVASRAISRSTTKLTTHASRTLTGWRWLRLPLVANSRHMDKQFDLYSLPVPDLYMGFGLYKHHESLAGHALDGFHENAWRMFAFNISYPE